MARRRFLIRCPKDSAGGGGSEVGMLFWAVRVFRGSMGDGAGSHGYSPAKRMIFVRSAYSRRYRWPSFFSTQTENPGYFWGAAFDERENSTSLSSTGA